MLNLRFILLLSFISLSLQDSHCLATIKICIPKDAPSTPNTKIAHCWEVEDDECEECENGYAISFNKKSCVSFPNCEELGENNKCSKCSYPFHVNSDGNCERTTCSDYNEKNECTNCHDGYHLNTKDKTCQKISIPYCERLENNDENKCSYCVGNIPVVDGKCVVPGKIIDGCSQYSEEGKCTGCSYNYNLKDGSCVFEGCKDDEREISYCGACEAGFYEDENEGLCVGFDGTKDSSVGIKIKNSLLILLLALII